MSCCSQNQPFGARMPGMGFEPMISQMCESWPLYQSELPSHLKLVGPALSLICIAIPAPRASFIDCLNVVANVRYTKIKFIIVFRGYEVVGTFRVLHSAKVSLNFSRLGSRQYELCFSYTSLLGLLPLKRPHIWQSIVGCRNSWLAMFGAWVARLVECTLQPSVKKEVMWSWVRTPSWTYGVTLSTAFCLWVVADYQGAPY